MFCYLTVLAKAVSSENKPSLCNTYKGSFCYYIQILSIPMFNCTVYKMIGNVLECLAVFGNYLTLINTSTAPIQDVLDYKYTHV